MHVVFRSILNLLLARRVGENLGTIQDLSSGSPLLPLRRLPQKNTGLGGAPILVFLIYKSLGILGGYLFVLTAGGETEVPVVCVLT